MASFTKHFSLCLLLLIISCSQIQARESKFFSKITHYVTVKSKTPRVEIPVLPPEVLPPGHIAVTPTQGPTPAPTPVPAPAPAYVDNEYGRDLYVPSKDEMLTSTKGAPATTTTAINEENYENEVLNEELNGESMQTRYPNSNFNNDVYSNKYSYNGNTNTKETNVYANLYSGNGYSSNYNENGEINNENTNGYINNYEDNMYTATYSANDNENNYNNEISNNNNNGYTTKHNTISYQPGRQGMSDTRFLENGKYYYELNNNGYTSNQNTDVYQTDQRGMSDTRFLENGRYYHDLNNKGTNNINAYEPEKTTTMNEALEGYKYNSNSNEFNTMEEYYKSQGYQETPEVNVP